MVYSLLLALLAMIAPDDAREAVAKLISPRSAEREAAQQTLEALGDAAYPALAAAADSSDLELRQKVASLLDAIEGRRLARPTMVALNFVDRPLSQVAQAISRSAGVTILVEPEGDARARTKTITLKAESPVPLWDAVDRLASAGGLRLEAGTNLAFRQQQMFAMNRMPQRRRVMAGNELVLRFDDGENPTAPAFDAGALRVTIGSLVLNRSRTFVRTPESAGQPEATAVFMVGLQVRAEPRLTIAAVDDPRLIEARDERGQSLLAGPAAAAGPPNPRPGRGFEPFPRNQPIMFVLKLPDQPGQKIARLRGSFRALVVGRRGEPLTIPLEGAEGKTFSAASSSVLVHTVRTAPDGRETTIEFTLDPLGGGTGQPIFNPLDPRSGLRPPPVARGQVEFFDAKGQLCHTVDLATVGMGFGSGGRTTIMIQPPPGTGPPTSARYYAATWAAVDVNFDFRDVPMP